ncbi:MAG: dihydropteroate synthase [Clostridia bacterium]|nr:dihydropteroate synthase [Clostridia bacterium]
MTAVFRHRDGVLSLDRTAVMGILNVTPDSFSDGGQYNTVDAAVDKALAMERDGAAIIDIGAQSTRPGHVPVSADEEWARLQPVLDALRGKLTVPISVDTYDPAVAAKAVKHGAAILNDVSGSLSNGMMPLAAEYGAGLVMMAQGAANIDDIRQYFETALTMAGASGLAPSQVCLDIGVGFHQSRDVDAAAVKHLPRILEGLPQTAVLCGASRKRLISHLTGDCPVDERLGGTLAVQLFARMGGARVWRVHDVKEAVQAAAVIDALLPEE